LCSHHIGSIGCLRASCRSLIHRSEIKFWTVIWIPCYIRNSK
jgi:hypothetical protein